MIRRAERQRPNDFHTSSRSNAICVQYGDDSDRWLETAAAELPGDGLYVLVGGVPADEDLDLLTSVVASRMEKLDRQPEVVTLVMSNGAINPKDAQSAAQRLCAASQRDVLAPHGVAFVVPGGSLFASSSSGEAGWWHFSSAAEPRRIAMRLPTPVWEAAFSRISANVAEAHIVEPIPAGVNLYPVGAPAQAADSLRFAIPPDPERPVILVGAPGGPPVSAEALASLLAAIPRQVRERVRVLSADSEDLLSTGQQAADLLGVEVHVGTGLPLLLEAGGTPETTPRTMVISSDELPVWEPFVTSVTCLPADGRNAPEPRLHQWRSPIDRVTETADGVFPLNKRWALKVTRAGLWVGPRGSTPGPSTAREVHSEVIALDLSVRDALDETLWPALDDLFLSLDESVRDRVMVQVHGTLDTEQLSTLRRLTVRHGLAIAPRGWRSGPASTTRAVMSAQPSTVSAPPMAQPAAPEPHQPPEPREDEPEALLPPVPTLNTSGSAVPASGFEQSHAARQESSTPITNEQAGSISAASVANAVFPTMPELPSAGNLSLPEPSGPSVHSPTPTPWPTQPTAGEQPEEPPITSPVQPKPAPEEPASPPPPPVDLSGILRRVAWHPPQPDSPAPELVSMDEPPALDPSGTDSDAGNEPSVSPLVAARVKVAPITGPDHHSTPDDRALLRITLGDEWDRRSAAVRRTLTHLPGMRMADESSEALTSDLVAVHAFINSVDGPASLDALSAAVASDESEAKAYLSCLASGLRALPSYRGVAVRYAGADHQSLDILLPGDELGSAFPVSAAAVDQKLPYPGEAWYFIWASTARRANSLAESEGPFSQDEVIFSPGTRLRVLARRDGPLGRAVLLRELAEDDLRSEPGFLNDDDTAITERLTSRLEQLTPAGTQDTPPVRCTGGLEHQ
ncbi:hypothetical protein [Streptomyces sp. NPDC090080]|uniref:hypothetical protein n=1 Tax=Streptomyces sp. NPDC090080 TaxID=3365939 RepID=UPI00381F702D